MVLASFSLREDYWESFKLREEDIEFIYNYLLETETPLTPEELVEVLVVERIRQEKLSIEKQRSSGGDLYLPEGRYKAKQKLVFPALSWAQGEVLEVRAGQNPDLGEFEVIKVGFDGGDVREYAAALPDHKLNQPPEIGEGDDSLNAEFVLRLYAEELVERMEEGLDAHEDFVRIAGKWFPRALLVDINIGHLNLAEAVLDMEGGGPLPTPSLIEQVEIAEDVNPKLLEFSMDLALQEDTRFDEVGSTGEVVWYLQRLEPEPVLQTPVYLRYREMDYDRSVLSGEMLALERDLEDEFSPYPGTTTRRDEVEICLIYPHWRAGTLPLSAHLEHLFPTAYEAPRIRFTLVDGKSKEKFPAWVVRKERYVYGLGDWYEQNGLIPGSLVRVSKGKVPGEVIINCDGQRSSREWIRTVLVGSDGGVVYAMLKQIVKSNYDERMAVMVPDVEAVDQVWAQSQKKQPPFERVVVNAVRELARLNPQGHVHASELYSAINVVRRCPPGPILSLVASRPWFNHVGDLHFRLTESEVE